MSERPPFPRLNRNSSLFDGLVFAGLGGGAYTLGMLDSSPYKNDGTLTGMVPSDDWVWVPELGRWGLDFSGGDDRIVCGSVVLGAADFTVSAWVNPAVTQPSNYPTILSVGTTAAGEWMLRNGSNITDVSSFYGNAGGIQLTGPSFVREQWNHICVHRQSGIASLFFNGQWSVSDATATDNLFSAKSLNIGSGEGAVNRWWAGLISDPLIHNRALSPAEIATLADPSNVMLSGLILPPQRKWWPVVSGGGADNTATSACESGGSSASVTASFTKPTFDANVAATIGGLESAVSATHTAPTFDAEVAVEVGTTASESSATSTEPSFDAEVVVETGTTSSAVNATHVPPTFDAEVATTIGAVASEVSATSSPPTFDADVVAETGTVSAESTASFVAPTGATVALTIGGAEAAASAAFTKPTFDAEAAVTIGGASAEASATYAGSLVRATASVEVGGAEASVATTFDPGTDTATASVEVGTVSCSASSTFTKPTFSATVAVTCGGLLANIVASSLEEVESVGPRLVLHSTAANRLSLFDTNKRRTLA